MATLVFTVCLAIFLGKCCILALYYRIFGCSRSVRYEVYGTFVLSLPIVAVGIVVVVMWTPQPGESWGFMKEHGDPWFEWLVLGSAILSLLIDCLLVFIPIPVILRMRLSRRKKGGVLALFLTGSM